MKSNTVNINTIAVALIMAAVGLLNSITEDNVTSNEYYGGTYNPKEYPEYTAPCYINGRRDPALAYNERSRAQATIFSIMEKLGMSLNGWAEFDNFVDWIDKGMSIEEAFILREVCSWWEREVQKVHAKAPIKGAKWHAPNENHMFGWWTFVC